ncbi:MAG: hypothetical protein H6822_04655 [Planctomycetaceae bacterium]|nr:hypothetical protein [Planctomycetales bacterium]MCB9921446.1 hypothetical protein [Planctomycetaceae bacterium]
MNDDELLEAFVSCKLPFEQWTHRAHVRVAYIYASRHGFRSALDQVRTRIKAYNKATGTPEAIDRGYHETMTRAFMTLIFAANRRTGPHASSDEFCEAHPELLTKLVLREHYSRERIMTWEAKQDFVEPDLRPLPKSLE